MALVGSILIFLGLLSVLVWSEYGAATAAVMIASLSRWRILLYFVVTLVIAGALLFLRGEGPDLSLGTLARQFSSPRRGPGRFGWGGTWCRRDCDGVDIAAAPDRQKCDTKEGQILLEELGLARRSAGLSQRALAERIGLDAQVIKRLERGIGSMATLVAVKEALNFQLNGLAQGRTLPEQLRNRRLKRGWSLDAVASRSGLSRATIASLERGGGSIASFLRLLAVLAPKARKRAPERAYWGQGDKEDRDSRFTPPDFMAAIYHAFGQVDLDPCGHSLSPVIARRRIILSEGGDGLVQDWSGRLVFMNPPFSALLLWLRRAYDQWVAGNVETVICLVPVRTDSAWFHSTLSAVADIYLLQGRVRFLNSQGRGQHTPFSLMIVAFGATAEQKDRYAALVPGYWFGRAAAGAHNAA